LEQEHTAVALTFLSVIPVRKLLFLAFDLPDFPKSRHPERSVAESKDLRLLLPLFLFFYLSVVLEENPLLASSKDDLFAEERRNPSPGHRPG
jgi:hypothetical protein